MIKDQHSKYFRLKIVLASIASLFMVNYVDYITGYDLHFYIFCFIPVLLCAWNLGRLSVFGMSVLGGVSWGFIDIFTGHLYSNQILLYWNSFVCFVSILIIGLVENGEIAIERYRAAKEFDRGSNGLWGMGGKEAIRELLKIDPDVKAIVFSGYSNDPVIQDYEK